MLFILLGRNLLGCRPLIQDLTTSAHFQLQAKIKSYLKNNEPPCRVRKPVPTVTLVMHALKFAFINFPTKGHKAVTNMVGLVFLFYICPGK